MFLAVFRKDNYYSLCIFETRRKISHKYIETKYLGHHTMLIILYHLQKKLKNCIKASIIGEQDFTNFCMLKERCRELGDINLVTADGSIDCQVLLYIQEVLSVFMYLVSVSKRTRLFWHTVLIFTIISY